MTFLSWMTGAEDRIWSLAMTPDDLLTFCREPDNVLDGLGVPMLRHLVVTFTPIPTGDFRSLFDGEAKHKMLSPAQGLIVRELADKAHPHEVYFAYGIAETGFVSIVGPPKAPDRDTVIPRPSRSRIDFDSRKPNLGFMHGELPADRKQIGEMICASICYPERWADMLDNLSIPVRIIRPDGRQVEDGSLAKIDPAPHRRVVFEQQGPEPAGCHNGLIVIIDGVPYLIDQIFKLWAS